MILPVADRVTALLPLLNKQEQQQLIKTVMELLHLRKELYGKKILWSELPLVYPELSSYGADTLRFYIQLCDTLELLCDYQQDEEGFLHHGLSATHPLKLRQRRRLKHLTEQQILGRAELCNIFAIWVFFRLFYTIVRYLYLMASMN